MTPTSEVIRLAREAGIEIQSLYRIGGKWHVSTAGSQPVERLARLISLAKAEEREACALACEAIEDEYQRTESRKYPELKSDAETGASRCAYAIRSRTKEAP